MQLRAETEPEAVPMTPQISPQQLQNFDPDMSAVQVAAQQISDALGKVTKVLAGNPWVGTAADQWTQEFTAWSTALLKLFGDIDTERRLMGVQIKG
jgi:hypothetical protein